MRKGLQNLENNENNNYKIIKGNFYLIDKEEVSMNIKNK